MAHICPWWIVFTFDNVLRGLFHDPQAIFGPYVEPGMTVMDVGCGGGFNSIGLARLVGEQGRVVAVDVEREMLDMLKKRADRAGLFGRIHIHRCAAESLGVGEQVGFVNAFWMVHEVPDTRKFLEEIHAVLRPNGHLLVAEPRFHVSSEKFQNMITIAEDVGFRLEDTPRIAFSKTAVFLRL